MQGWLAYKNAYFGYEFAYPPEARISTQGVTGFPSDELPEDMTAEEYLLRLEEIYPDNLCVSVRYEAGFVTFVPAGEKEREYTGPCGVTGVGDYVFTDLIETVVIDGVPITGSGLRMRGTAGAWHGEFIMMDVSDTITIHYGGYEGYGGAGARRFTEEDFLEAKETLMKIITSFRQEEKSR